MAIKKNAAKADIGPKKQVKATFAECTAENPLKCKYHGPKMLQAELDKLMGKGAAKVKKTKKGYEITSDDAYDAYNKVAALLPNAKGSLGFKKVFFILGDGGFITPEGEAEMEEADTLSPDDAPKNNTVSVGESNDDDLLVGNELDADLIDNFADLEDVTAEATEDIEAELLGNSDYDDVLSVLSGGEYTATELTDEDIKKLVAFKGVAESKFDEVDGLMDSYKAIITTGKNPSGNELTNDQKAWYNDLISKATSENGDELPALKVLKKTMKGIGALQESPAPVEESPAELSAEMEKCKNKWDSLLDKAVNEKKLKGTQYWAETIAPIVEAYNEGISAKDVVKAFDAVYDLKNAVKEAPDNSAQKEEHGQPFTDEEFKEALSKHYEKTGYNTPTEVAIAMWKQAALSGTTNGEPLSEHNQELLSELAKTAGEESSVGKAIKETLAKLNPGKYGKNTKKFATSLQGEGTDDGLTTEELEEKFTKLVDEVLYSNMFNNDGFVEKYDKIIGIKNGGDLSTAVNMLEKLVHPPKKPKKGAKEALAEALSVHGISSSSSLSGNGESVVSEDMLKPLDHDDSKFPQNITQDEIENAIAHPVKKLGGNTLGSRLIEIGGKQYVCKAAYGTGASVIKNGYNADMAYRAGGVYAPDSKLYTFGDGKVYKLSEYIKGKTLWDVWRKADEPTRDKIRKDILKGYPLDVLFSNYDVLGTSPEVIDKHEAIVIPGPDGSPQETHVAFDNIIIGDDGHAYRIDNDGSFAMKGNGYPKGANWVWGNETDKDGNIVKGADGKPKKIKVSAIFGKNAPVAHEFYDNWEDREWIDDFRTMRRNERCAGIFDRYSTADIFLSAGNINLDAVVGTLPKGLQKALAKPLFEMKQMTMRALSASLSGVKNDEMLSAALDASYEASKQGFREACIGEISFSSGGIGAKKSDKGEIDPYPVKKPAPPEDPSKKFAAGSMLSNAEYKGTKVSEIILNAAKTINYHAGFVMTDAQGNKLGGGKSLPKPDFSPNSSKIEEFKKIDREKIVELAKNSDSAKDVLAYYDSVATSIANGYKLPVQEVKKTEINELLPSGFKTKAEVEFETNKEKVMAQYHSDLKEYNDVTLPDYFKGKKEWEEKEKAKLKAGVHGLEGNFYDIANEFMEASYNTDGIALHNGESIDFIELGKYQNKYGGGVAGATTDNDSWTPASSHIKVLDLLMSGWKLADIVKISNDDPLVNNGHHSGKKAKDWFIGEAKKMLANPEQTRREMKSYSVFKGLQVVKLENETADVSLSTGGKVPWIDHSCHTVTLIRKESFDNASEYTIAPVVQKGGNVSCGFQSNGSIGIYPYAYDVPLWNVSYTYSDENHKESKVSAYQGSEHEWVANLVGLTPCRVNSNTNASKNVLLSRENATIKKERDKRMSRLAHFFTTMADLKKMVKKSVKWH